MVGAIQSTATYSSFVKEKTLRLAKVELTYDDERAFFVDDQLASLFAVQGLSIIKLGGGGGFSGAFLPSPFVKLPAPTIKLGYVCKHSSNGRTRGASWAKWSSALRSHQEKSPISRV